MYCLLDALLHLVSELEKHKNKCLAGMMLKNNARDLALIPRESTEFFFGPLFDALSRKYGNSSEINSKRCTHGLNWINGTIYI